MPESHNYGPPILSRATTLIADWLADHGDADYGATTDAVANALWSATVAVVTRYGEDSMQVQPTSDVIALQKATIADFGRQLLAAKARLGEPPTIDVSAADAEWERTHPPKATS